MKVSSEVPTYHLNKYNSLEENEESLFVLTGPFPGCVELRHHNLSIYVHSDNLHKAIENAENV